jgi:hypothetical protein
MKQPVNDSQIARDTVSSLQGQSVREDFATPAPLLFGFFAGANDDDDRFDRPDP